MKVTISPGDWRRDVSAEAQLELINRYYEEDPTIVEGQAALIARPGLRRWLTVGAGPSRGFCSTQGSFNDALFVVSGNALYRIDIDETVTLIGTGLNDRAAPASP